MNYKIEEVTYKKKSRKARTVSKTSKLLSPTKKKASKKKIKRGSLVKKLDAIFSTWIRTKYSQDGMVGCYTCDRKLPIKMMQNGHYVSRSVRSLRWDENNCRPQCYGDNVMHGGQPITFRENLVKELGEPFVLELEARRHELFNPSDEWLKEQILFYTESLQKLDNQA